MATIAFDCAIAGNWQKGRPADAQDFCTVRVAYARLEGGAVTDRGCLILRPARRVNFLAFNREVGGVDWEHVVIEGQHARDLAADPFWSMLEQADAALCFFRDFHVDALNKLASEIGIDLTERGPRRVFDLMTQVDPLVGAKNAEGRPKVPSLAEAYGALALGGLVEARSEALRAPRPVEAFGMVQIDAVAALALAFRERRAGA